MKAGAKRKKYDFVVVGSGGGGGTISWLLAKAGYSVAMLEQGSDVKRELLGEPKPSDAFEKAAHDEYRYRIGKPSPSRRPRGDYNTFRRAEDAEAVAKPFKNGWTATGLGGGSVFWGTWAFRALPIDFRLATHYAAEGQLSQLKSEGYTVADWPIDYDEMVPYYNVAEALLAVSGDREALLKSTRESPWYKAFQDRDYFGAKHFATGQTPFPCGPYPRTPVGRLVEMAFEKRQMFPASLPSGIVRPGSGTYETRKKIAESLAGWQHPGPFWSQQADKLWSDRVRDACNMCGYCGEYVCWGHFQPKSGARESTIEEILSEGNADVILGAKALEVLVNKRTARATGVRYLDVSKPDRPRAKVVLGKHVIVSCSAVQSPRLLFLSGPPRGLGNSSGHLGRHVTFHLFGLSAKAVLKQTEDFRHQGLLHGEFGHTGNVTTMWPYFVNNGTEWIKAGTFTSTAKKNPLENAVDAVELKGRIGADLLAEMERYNRTVEVRLTGDDLPMKHNRVDLDPNYVDEYGVPVARVTRSLGPAEWRMYRALEPTLKGLFEVFDDSVIDKKKDISVSPAIVTLVGDHQMGTCRMGFTRKDSVVDRHCRLWDAPNVFVVDSSFMPTGLGLNPMVSVVANALRVGTWIVNELRAGRPIDG